MKTAYFDCFAGASGDMILGSLIDSGLSLNTLRDALSTLPLKGYSISARKAVKKGIGGVKFDVSMTEDHHHRDLGTIRKIIQNSGLSKAVQERAIEIFTRLAEAEAHIHRTSIDKIHFHEVGAVDAIVDITGASAALELLGIEEVRASRLHIGTGTLECAHGTLPVPAPAAAELLKGIPVYSTGIESELVTPTGAAILSTLAASFGPIPSLRIEATGYGLGGRDLPIPNFLRVMIGESGLSTMEDSIQLIETNIDDMNPEFYEYVMERLFEAGARDVYLTPVIMKKNRPGTILSVLTSPELTETLTAIVLEETSTLGVRISEFKKRHILDREIQTVNTPWGKINIKISRINGEETGTAPEYEDCKRIAKKAGLPLKKIYEEVYRLIK
jgi:uncharacterized protein (TIGR00299 family) protein